MLNTNQGDTQMGNLLLENFINEINTKREDAIQSSYEYRMDRIKKQIANIPAKVEKWNELYELDLKAEAVENGFKTECDTRSHFARLNGRRKSSIKDQFSFFQHIFVFTRKIKSWVENKQYSDGGYYQTTHEVYKVDEMENIEKEIMMLTKIEINQIFDMYLSRVCGEVTKIDYCSEITNCEIKSFDQKGYPVSELAISTVNNTSCTIRTSVKWNCSKYGKIFGQYPTTIHNIKRAGSDKTGSIYQVASDNFNHVWTSFKAIEKNEKTNRAISRLEEELSDVQKTNPEDRFYNPKYVAKRVKKLNERIAKESAKLIDVRAYRDVGQSLIKAVA